MPMVSLGIHLFLLQTYFVEDDPMQARIVIIAIGVIIAFAVVLSIVRKGGGGRSGGGGSYGGARSFSGFALRRVAGQYGLNSEQTKLLEYIFRSNSVSDPARVMRESALLDRHFKRAYTSIAGDSKYSDRTQQSLSKLFLLRNAIEAAPVGDESYQPVENSQAVIKYGNDTYNVKIYLSQSNRVVTEVPKNAVGTTLRIPKGTSVTLTYLTRSGNSYSLVCDYESIEKTQYGAGFLMSSTGRARPLTKRQTRRRQVNLRCEFYFVQVLESGKGKNKTSKLIVSPKRFSGVIRDISAGGCSIKTPVPVQASSRLKINCNLGNGEQVAVLGLVIRSNRSSTGTVIHIKFLKVPMRAFNSINTLVFGFNEKSGHAVTRE